MPDNFTTEIVTPAELLNMWKDPEATLGGVVAITSRCGCGQEAWTVVRSPRWGEWDTCNPCGDAQIAVLHYDGTWQDEAVRTLGLDVIAAAFRCINLDRMLSVPGL